ncbi:MAG: hypothetical protein MI920_28310 [Kiloniellales bacterium]|nr:hypothetical protein [Kiloniellales bacterium]
MADISSEIGQIQSELADLKPSVNQLNSNIGEVQRLQDTTKGRLDVALTALFTVFGGLVAIVVYLITIHGDVVEVKVVVGQLQSDLTKLEASIGALEDTVRVLQKISEDFERLAPRFEETAKRLELEEVMELERRTEDLQQVLSTLIPLLQREGPLPKELAPTLDRIEKLLRDIAKERESAN